MWKRGSVSNHAERQLCGEVVLQLKDEGQEGARLHWEGATASGKLLRQETQINRRRKQTEASEAGSVRGRHRLKGRHRQVRLQHEASEDPATRISSNRIICKACCKTKIWNSLLKKKKKK